MAGSPMYTAPELLDPPIGTDGARTVMSDVFAFGILTAVLLAGEHPFKLPNRMIGALILAIITGRRPSRPADANMHIWFLAEQCWQQDMSLRPTMHAIYLCLSPFCQLDPASMRYVYEMPSAEFDEAAYNATLRRPPPSSDTTALNPIIEVFAESSIDEELDVRFDLGLSFTDDGVGPDTIELGSHIYPTLGDNGGGEDLSMGLGLQAILLIPNLTLLL